MKSAPSFHFLDCSFAPETATAQLRYSAGETVFEERLVFPPPPSPLESARLNAVEHCLQFLHLAAGVSYYKALFPEQIKMQGQPLSQGAADFFGDFYRKGLAEFAYRNRLSLKGRVSFPAGRAKRTPPPCPPLPRRTLVPCGGGQGSIVTLEGLKQIGEPISAVSVNCHPAARRAAETAGVPLLCIERRLSPELMRLNQEGAWNGHVPVTGILSFAFALLALLHGFDTIVMSNEKSANEGNLQLPEGEVNHQWSKSREFEAAFQRMLQAEICPGLRYFSLLRPCYELQVARFFAAPLFAPYRKIFLSCNRAFRQDAAPDASWCGDCDKCRFMFLILAAFLPRAETEAIFGNSLLRPEQRAGFEALLGLAGDKPFDCVGTWAESQAALVRLAAHEDWREEPLIKELSARIEAPRTSCLEMENLEQLPPPYPEALRALARAAP